MRSSKEQGQGDGIERKCEREREREGGLGVGGGGGAAGGAIPPGSKIHKSIQQSRQRHKRRCGEMKKLWNGSDSEAGLTDPPGL